MQSVMYLDLSCKEREQIFFFMLNAYLCSRLDTDNESDGDEEVNMYMAQLLNSLVDGSFYVDRVEMLASTPVDVFTKVEEDHSDRHKLQVYRANADHRLVAFGVFAGFGGHQSLYRRTLTPPEAYLEEAQQYYSWAALFCTRLPGRYRGLSLALEKIAADFDTYCDILGHMSSKYFNLLPQLGSGELFHLARQAHQAALPSLEEKVLDQLLDAYNQWKAQPGAENRRRFQEACACYQQIKPDFVPEHFNRSNAGLPA